MKITMHIKQAAILISLLLFIMPASATYAGDKPLQTVIHDKHHGALDFSLGNSRYSGELDYNKTYAVNFKVDAPAGSSIKIAKAYVYWVWSKKGLDGIYPQINASLENSGTIVPLPEGHMYTDTKGFVSRYDYFSGMNTYDLSGKISGSGNYSISLVNADKNGSTFCVQGIGLLLVNDDQKSPTIEYWINEGCDMLYADYGITPEMATTTTFFKGDVNSTSISDARLITVSPSGGYSSGREARSKLYFNEKPSNIPVLGDIIQLLFGSGKNWENVYQTNETVQVALDEKPVGDYLNPNENFASIQDNGDYLLATNALLVLKFKEPESSEKGN